MSVLKNAKHELFAQELAKGSTATEAYVKAGYRPDDGNAARLTGNDRIKARVDELLGNAAKRVEVDRAWVMGRLVENVDRSMQIEEVKDAKGVGTGEYRYEGSVANKSLELLGKEFGMFKERVEHTGKDGAPIAIVDQTEAGRRIAFALARAQRSKPQDKPQPDKA